MDTFIKFTDSSGNSLSAQYNPNLISHDAAVNYQEGSKAIGEGENQTNTKYTGSNAPSWKFVLIYDDSESEQPTVVKKVKALRKKLIGVVGDKHEPFKIKVEFGSIGFLGVCTNFSLTYNGFDLEGEPLYAEVSLSFKELPTAAVQAAATDQQSPDITHLITINEGDHLTNISSKIYGSPAYVFQLAKANNLDSFRGIEHGKKIYFPPLQ
jgi:hypothetical protein